jgi:hypothetical protein
VVEVLGQAFDPHRPLGAYTFSRLRHAAELAQRRPSGLVCRRATRAIRVGLHLDVESHLLQRITAALIRLGVLVAS